MNPEILLYRIVHFSCVQGSKITSQVFQPTSSEPRLLSVYNGSKISPDDVWKHFTSPSQSRDRFAGIVGVSVAECQDLGIPVKVDARAPCEVAAIDFSGMSHNQIRRKAIILRDHAIARGWMFRP